MTGFSPMLARWIADASFPREPAFLEIARLSFMDTFACMVAGCRAETAAGVIAAGSEIGPGDIPVFGTRARLSLDWAALANGAAAHALDFDDNFEPALGHASAVLVPALLTVGHRHRSSGQSLIDAYIAGLEVMGRLGLLMNMTHYASGWHSTSTLGTPAVAGAMARLFGLTQAQTAHALSIAASLAGGSKIQFGTTAKHLHCGFAGQSGIKAAYLAKSGLEGAGEAIAGPWGLAGLMDGNHDCDPMSVLHNLGDSYMMSQYGLMRKLYPCCAAMHRALDAAIQLTLDPGFKLDSLERITVSLAAVQTQNLRFPEPTTPSEARFSLHYCLAYALVHGAVPPEAFEPEMLHARPVRDLMPKIFMIEDPALPGDLPPDAVTPSTVRLKLRDGTELEKTVIYQQGHGTNPLSARQVAAKFSSLVEPVLGAARCEALLAQFSRLEEIETISGLAEDSPA